MMWPGFQAIFNAPWPSTPLVSLLIDDKQLEQRMLTDDRHVGIYQAVELYEQALRKHLHEDGTQPHLWFVVVPENVFRFGRPKSKVPAALKIESTHMIGRKAARSILRNGTMFKEEAEAAALYEYELSFHNQLKTRILDTNCAIQDVRETTLAPDKNAERRSLQDPASVAWNLGTTSFYKADGQPWRIAAIRDDVCYVGLVFKKIDNPKGDANACCGAQMFLTTGDGVVFRGAPGPWYLPQR
jgi:hypothetical protein